MGPAPRPGAACTGVGGTDRRSEGHPVPQAEDQLIWKTSTYTDSGSCVEWARPAGGVLVRDTKDRQRAQVSISAPAWQVFAGWAKTATV
ncbi:MAG: DUF397 domain-containing protein [Nonomuraea sp.]|nr:DUF397 domain-containing protein [Nonomuraea sp.]